MATIHSGRQAAIVPQPRADSPFRFVTPTPFRWVDVDSEGIVNHAVYLSLMEQARFCYFEQLGLLGGKNIPFVLAETTVRYRMPGVLRMEPVTAARVTRLGRTSFAMDFEIRVADGVLVDASAVLVFVDTDLQPTPIPDRVRDRIAAFEGISPHAATV